MQSSSIDMRNGKYVATVTSKEFETMEQAQTFTQECGQIGRPKQDLRKIRYRAFEEFCEMLPEQTSTEKRAKCKICVKLYGHVKGLAESNIVVKWTVGKGHTSDIRDRENRAASRHLSQKVQTEEGLKYIKELHDQFYANPSKYEAPAPAPPHQPLLPTYQERHDADFLSFDISTGNQYAREIKKIAIAACLTIVAVSEPVGDTDVKEHAIGIMRKSGVDESALTDEYIDSAIDHFVCTFPRGPMVDMAIKILHEYYIQGILKEPKNARYLQASKGYYQQAFLDYCNITQKAKLAFYSLYQPAQFLTYGSEQPFFKKVTEKIRSEAQELHLQELHLPDYYLEEMNISLESATPVLFSCPSDDDSVYFEVLQGEPPAKRKRGRPPKR